MNLSRNKADKHDYSQKRYAKSVAGCPIGEFGEDYFYACVGRPLMGTGCIVEAITVSRDMAGSTGFADAVRVWGRDEKLLWEGPLTNLEGVSYV